MRAVEEWEGERESEGEGEGVLCTRAVMLCSVGVVCTAWHCGFQRTLLFTGQQASLSFTI